ncbi:hypothetical protein P8M88_003600 [Escherichia coli]|nr:hypothetical protein [Escherichia coli]EKS5551846.1 hypothetical protein [Escherichia coli]EKY6621050.1 hypothetical protein [Escherichia coli]ELJ4034151.1 hypothetical protein [Escherichia coli]ELO4997556.1 hypothetical protein [Escherichia coli]
MWITYKGKLPGRITGSLKMPPSTLRSEKDDIESLIEKLEGSVADLNKKLSVLIPSEDEKNAAMSIMRRFTITATKSLTRLL